ncbi:hypothetical protein CR163_000845 [Prosthecochloris sp. ZM_2]|uniref:hypothetical protein n=1 Tax=Prosthecochloris sp. ZM_2 TaxID=2045206 RepID=UPI000DF73B6E|nr:hypothetical protein [Prosthecochloris sp. ZM_2]RNA66116.1 hypothetical protein CR163_000845 [Prosthecochloris sp. ZM_2]
MSAVQRFLCCCILLPVALSGCSGTEEPRLDDVDRRFAAFYSEYLLTGGLAADGRDSSALMPRDHIDSLLDRHDLSLELLHERAERYQERPGLWKQVLLDIRSRLDDSGAEGGGE